VLSLYAMSPPRELWRSCRHLAGSVRCHDISIESTHIIEIDSFVPRSEIDQRFFDAPYYVTPNEPVGQEAFAVIREAMRDKGMVALGRLVLSKRERVIARPSRCRVVRR
jgi:non-homologous end joining protein Ku